MQLFFSILKTCDSLIEKTSSYAGQSLQWRLRLGIGALTLMALAVIICLIAVKDIYLSFDSINNYVHIWYISDHLYDSGWITLRNPWLDGGEALTYPYGFVPWTLTAIFYPLFGDYTVTWMMLLGFVLMLLVVYRTRLQGHPWLFILFLLCPTLIEALLSFQFAFIWGALFGYLYIHSVEKEAKGQALIWWLLAVSTHLLMVGSLLMVYNLFVCLRNKQRCRFIMNIFILSLPVLVLVVWYSSLAPSVEDNSVLSLAETIFRTLLRRGSLFFFPFLLMALKRRSMNRLIGINAALVLISVLLLMNIPQYKFSNLLHQADNPYRDFLNSSSFEPGATYRILEATDREQGHYFLVKNGAVLAQELFGQSQERHSWEPSDYRKFLIDENIDYVVVNHDYTVNFNTNERQLLEDMVAEGYSEFHYLDQQDRFEVFDVQQVRNYN